MDKIIGSWKSFVFVSIQFAALGAIALTGPLLADNPLLLILELLGIGLGFWAVWIMKPGYFNITPDPRSNSVLVKGGPYRLVRHPMYLALLMATIPLVLDHFSSLRLFLWIVLLIDLILKIYYEEQLLLVGLKGYADYRGNSHRLIPFIF